MGRSRHMPQENSRTKPPARTRIPGRESLLVRHCHNVWSDRMSTGYVIVNEQDPERALVCNTESVVYRDRLQAEPEL